MNRSLGNSHWPVVSCALAIGAVPAVAQAGMPSYTLTDLARMRLETISFFLLAVLLSAWAIQGLWNGLRKDITKLPRLSYRGALFGTILWGLLCLCVLTMISGARELLTPGAWEKTGATYQLGDSEDDATDDELEVTLADRELQLVRLQLALWEFAHQHAGAFPESIESSEFEESLWIQPGQPPVRYLYHGGHTVEEGQAPIVIEYAIYNDDRQLILRADGEVTMRDLTSREVPPATED